MCIHSCSETILLGYVDCFLHWKHFICSIIFDKQKTAKNVLTAFKDCAHLRDWRKGLLHVYSNCNYLLHVRHLTQSFIMLSIHTRAPVFSTDWTAISYFIADLGAFPSGNSTRCACNIRKPGKNAWKVVCCEFDRKWLVESLFGSCVSCIVHVATVLEDAFKISVVV